MIELDSETIRYLEKLKLDALAEFAAGAGHEINNPLAIISGYAQLLLTRIDDPDARTWLGIIIAQTRRAYEMIADTRTFARPPVPQPADFLLPDALRDFLNRKQTDADERKISWSVTPSIAEWPQTSCCSDPAHLVTILDAVVSNAFEAAGESGQVSFATSLANDGNTLIFIIEDNGPGIPPEFRPQIFSPYFSGRQSGRGLGFGLCKAWRLLEGLGGTIDLEPVRRFTTGCRWVIRLPLFLTPVPDKNAHSTNTLTNATEFSNEPETD